MPTIHKIRKIVTPLLIDAGKPIGQIQSIESTDKTITLQLTLALMSPQALKELKATIQKHIQDLDSSLQIIIKTQNVQAQQHSSTEESRIGAKNIIAVSSCKGGVGKSTLAVLTAYDLAKRGFSVGLLDADIYGPSLPVLLNLKNPKIRQNEAKKIIPIDHHGVQVMSFGFLLGDKAAVMRGPIVTRYIQQMLFQTEWKDLDYLIIDMPPGTGDVHLTITQNARLTGAIIVTTPHQLSLVDVARGILMYETVNVPILGVIENMAYFKPAPDIITYPFGNPSAESLNKQFGVPILGQLGLLPELREGYFESIKIPELTEMMNLMLTNLETQKSQHLEIPKIQVDEKDIHLEWNSGEAWTVAHRKLRLNSRDALSVNELTGEQILKDADIREDIAAQKIVPLGNYAISVDWNDGHSAGIYPYTLIKSISNITTPTL